MGSASWFNKGFDALDAMPDTKKQNRFWLKTGQEKKIVFLDDQPLNVSGVRK